MSPAEDALLLLRLAERHLGSLRGTLDSSVPWSGVTREEQPRRSRG
jgi:hypothetical protein